MTTDRAAFNLDADERYARHELAAGDPSANGHHPSGDAKPSGMFLLPATDVKIKNVRWVDRGRIPLGMISGTFGVPGLGKSLLATDWAARLSCGRLHGDLPGSHPTLYVTGEDSPEYTLVPRFLAAGGDPEQLYFVRVRRDGFEGGMVLPDDAPDLLAQIKDKEAKLVVIDPLNAHLSGDIDSHRDADVRRALAPLARIAEEADCAIHLVGHLNKRDVDDFFLRVSGSVGVYGAIRSGLLVALDPEADEDADDKDKPRVLVHGKHNVSPAAPTLRFKIVTLRVAGDNGELVEAPKVEWLGEAADVSARDALGNRDARGPGRPAKVGEAIGMLCKALKDGPRLRSELENLAKSERLGWRTVETSKAELGVEHRQIPVPGQRGAGPSWWKLPGVGEWPATPNDSDSCGPFIDPESPGQNQDEAAWNEGPQKPLEIEKDRPPEGSLPPCNEGDQRMDH
jgi:hypothetical protein